MRANYLDGLRGWAAVVVAIYHATTFFFDVHPSALGWQPVVCDGVFAVFVFFALSGYVLSAEFFRTGQRRAVWGLALRRYPRLTIPVAASVALAMLLIVPQLMFNIRVGELTGGAPIQTIYTDVPTLQEAAWFSLVGVYLSSSGAQFNPVLWTMYFEMAGSLALFAFLLIVGRNKVLRVAGHATFIGATWYLESPVLAVALGALLANLMQSPWVKLYRRQRGAAALGWTILVASIWLGGSRTIHIDALTLSVASAGVLAAVLILPALQRALSSPFSLVLGRYSFSLYLTHYLIMCSVAAFAFVWTVEHGVDSLLTRGAIVAISLVLYALAARLFKPIDDFAIRISRKVSAAVMGFAVRPVAPEAAYSVSRRTPL